MSQVYKTYVAANEGIQGICKLGNRADEMAVKLVGCSEQIENIMKSLSGVVGKITTSAGDAVQNAPQFVADKVDMAMGTVKSVLRRKDKTFLGRLSSRFVKHGVGITASCVTIYHAKSLTEYIAGATTLASLLGLEEEVFIQFCATAATIMGDLGGDAGAEFQADVPLEKITLMLTTIVGMFGPQTGPLGNILKTAGSAARNADAVQKLWRLIEDIAGAMGFPITERSKQANDFKDKVTEVLDAGLEHQSRFACSPSDYCRETNRNSFNNYRKKVQELVDLSNAKHMREIVGHQQMMEISQLQKKVKDMEIEINRLSSLTGVRPEPIGVIIAGASGLGKSAYVEGLCHEVKNCLEEMSKQHDAQGEYEFCRDAKEWLIWDQNPADDYDQGYCGQAIHSIDDLFQRADQKDHAKIINYISTRALPTHQAALEAKGLPYKSRLIIGTCNHFPQDSVVINSIEALHNRFMFKLRAELKPGAEKPQRGQGDRDPDFSWLHMYSFDRMGGDVRYPSMGLIARHIAEAIVVQEKKYLATLKAYFDRDNTPNAVFQADERPIEDIPAEVVAAAMQEIDDTYEEVIPSGATFYDNELFHELRRSNSETFLDAVEEIEVEEPVPLPKPLERYIPIEFAPPRVKARINIQIQRKIFSIRDLHPDIMDCHFVLRGHRDERIKLRDLIKDCPYFSMVDQLYLLADPSDELEYPSVHKLWRDGFWICVRDLYRERAEFFCTTVIQDDVPVGVLFEANGLEIVVGLQPWWRIVKNTPWFTYKALTAFRDCVNGIGDMWGNTVYAATFWVINKLGMLFGEQDMTGDPEVEQMGVVCAALHSFMARSVMWTFILSSVSKIIYWIVGKLMKLIRGEEKKEVVKKTRKQVFEDGSGSDSEELEDSADQKKQKKTRLVAEDSGEQKKQKKARVINEDSGEQKKQKKTRLIAEDSGEQKNQRKQRVIIEDSGDQKSQKKKRVLVESRNPRKTTIAEDYHSVIKKKTRIAEQVSQKLSLDTSESDRSASDSEEDEVSVPEIESDAAFEASYDPNGVAIMESVLTKNVVKISHKASQLFGWATGRYILFPSHLINALGDNVQVWIGDKPVTCVVCAFRRDWDLCLAEFPKDVQAYPGIGHHLLSDVDVVSGSRQLTALLAYPTRTSNIMQMVNYEFREELKMKRGSEDMVINTVAVTRGFHTHGMASQAGDCGGPLVEMNPRSVKKLIGMHIACAKDGSKGYSTIVSKERLESLIADAINYSFSSKEKDFQSFSNSVKVRALEKVDAKGNSFYGTCYGLANKNDLLIPLHLADRCQDVQLLDERSKEWVTCKYVAGNAQRDLAKYAIPLGKEFPDITSRIPKDFGDDPFKIECEIELRKSCQVFRGMMLWDPEDVVFGDGRRLTEMFTVCPGVPVTKIVDGDCGSLLVTEAGHICGMVSYDCTKYEEIGCLSLSRKIIDDLKEKMPRVEEFESAVDVCTGFPKIEFVDQGDLNPNDGTFFTDGGFGNHLPDGNFGFMGDVIGQHCQAAPPITELKATPFKMPFEKRRVPSVLSILDPRVKNFDHLPFNGDGQRDLLLSQCMKYGDPHYPMDIPMLLDMKDQLLDYSVQVFGKDKIGVTKHPGQNWWFTINGKPNRDDFSQMNVKASVGVPWSRDSVGTKKVHYLESAEATYHGKVLQGKMPKDTLLWDVTLAKLEYAQMGYRTHSVWKDCLKDELRPIEKIETPKTRLFSCAPMETVMCARYLFEPYKAKWMQHADELFHSVGIDCKSFEWTKLALALKEKGKDVADGDFSSFDGKLPVQLMEVVGMLIIETIRKVSDDGESTARYVIWDEFIRTLQVAEDTVYVKLHGNPSGNPMTTVMNCWCNFFLHWYSYRTLTGRHSLQDFLEQVCFRSFGDDCIYSVRPEFTEQFNPIKIGEVMAKFGQVYTNGSKTVQGAFSRLEEVQYLKRKFVCSPTGTFYLCPLAKESVEGCFNYSQIPLDDGETWASTAYEQLLEMAMHGREYYEWARERLSKRNVYLSAAFRKWLNPVLSLTFDMAMAELRKRFGVSDVFLG